MRFLSRLGIRNRPLYLRESRKFPRLVLLPESRSSPKTPQGALYRLECRMRISRVRPKPCEKIDNDYHELGYDLTRDPRLWLESAAIYRIYRRSISIIYHLRQTFCSSTSQQEIKFRKSCFSMQFTYLPSWGWHTPALSLCKVNLPSTRLAASSKDLSIKLHQTCVSSSAFHMLSRLWAH